MQLAIIPKWRSRPAAPRRPSPTTTRLPELPQKLAAGVGGSTLIDLGQNIQRQRHNYQPLTFDEMRCSTIEPIGLNPLIFNVFRTFLCMFFARRKNFATAPAQPKS
jgi:hypothetical protein